MLKKKTYTSLIYYTLLVGVSMLQLFSFESFSERSFKTVSYPLDNLKLDEAEENSAHVKSGNKHVWLESYLNTLSKSERNYWILRPIQPTTFIVSTILNPPIQFFYLNRNSLPSGSSDDDEIKA